MLRHTALVLAALVSSASLLHAQNLVLNPGFEDSLKCPSGSGAFTTYVDVWTKPTYASSDYFFTGCPVAPANEPPHGGQAYAGIIVYDPADYREYITGTLATPLAAGVTYEVSFFASLLDNCIDGITELGAWLTPVSPSYPNANPILLTPQIQHTSPLIVDNGWKQVKGTFQAAGGEQYITIGAFVPDSLMTFTPAPGTNSWFDVYYFIDDVTVARDSATGLPGAGDPATPWYHVFPNPASAYWTLEIPGGAGGLLGVTDAAGRPVLRRPLAGSRAVVDGTAWPCGTYFYEITVPGRPPGHGRLIILR